MKFKDCYCHNCNKAFHPLGIMSHRAMHRSRGENCTITYSDGSTKSHDFEKWRKPTGKGGE